MLVIRSLDVDPGNKAKAAKRSLSLMTIEVSNHYDKESYITRISKSDFEWSSCQLKRGSTIKLDSATVTSSI